MSRSLGRGRFAAVVLSVIVSVLWLLATTDPLLAQARPTTESPPQVIFFTSSYCTECHGQDDPENSRYPNEMVLLNEWTTWRTHDKHEFAFKVLLGERSRKMAERLGWEKGAHEMAECTACHGSYVSGSDDRVTDYRDEDEGVTCVVCHGPYEAWVREHYGPRSGRDNPDWRALDASVKEEVHGMTNLRDVVRRGELCASCHVGDATQGRFVTHAMYAAGHPPLPPFELRSFTDAMPRHWEAISEKSPAIRERFAADPSVRYVEGESEKVREAVLGNAVLLPEAARSLAVDTQRSLDAESETWPELAHFDCYACHHDLRTPSWRQERGYDGPPGRPRLKRWSGLAFELMLRHLPNAAELEQEYARRLEALDATLDAQPFGKARDLAPAAEDLANWAEARVLEAKELRFDEDLSRRLLSDLTVMAEERLLDPESARQASAILLALTEALSEEVPKTLVARLEKMLPAELRLTKDFRKWEDPRQFRDQKPNIDGYVAGMSEKRSRRMERLDAFDPAEFRRAIEELRRSLER